MQRILIIPIHLSNAQDWLSPSSEGDSSKNGVDSWDQLFHEGWRWIGGYVIASAGPCHFLTFLTCVVYRTANIPSRGTSTPWMTTQPLMLCKTQVSNWQLRTPVGLSANSGQQSDDHQQAYVQAIFMQLLIPTTATACQYSWEEYTTKF